MSIAPFYGFRGRRTDIFEDFPLYFRDPNHDFPFMSHLVPPPHPEVAPFARTKIDYKETPDSYHFRAELPGVRKEEVKVEVEDGRVLHISGKRTHQKEEKGDNWRRVEQGCGAFMSKFNLPHDANPEHVRSYMDNGVLTIIVPKEKVKRVEKL